VKEKEKERGQHDMHTHTGDIRCFKYICRSYTYLVPHQKDHDLKGQNELSSSSDSVKSSEHESEDIYSCDGDLLMIRRLLNNQPGPQHESYRVNIFYTRCKISSNTYSLIIDSGSCCNCYSTRLVEKLNLNVMSHSKPYKIHWLNEDEDKAVDKQVKVKLSNESYEHKVLCDIVPMEVCHILLGRPWLLDKKFMHNGLTNEITFTHKIKKCVLHPLTPNQVIKDQVYMKQKREKEKEKKSENLKSIIKDELEVWELNVPSHKVIQKENIFPNKKIKGVFFNEQPSYLFLCKGTLVCTITSSESKVLPTPIQKLLKKIDDSEGPIGLPHFGV